MIEYSELIDRLHEASKVSAALTVFLPQSDGNAMVKLLDDAADAIAELSKDRDSWKATAKEEREEYWYWFAQYQKDVPRWVSVTERLPKEMDQSCGGWSAEIRPSDDVLVWLSSEKRQSVAWYSHAYNEWTTVDENTVYCFGEVTHWKPLPEPPKEE